MYDFDTYKLWSFLCAYYYDFDADNDDIYYWEFDGDTEDLLEEIFNDEYEFVYWYDNQSRWEELSPYNYWGGGNASSGTYYRAEQDAYIYDGQPYKYRFKPIAITSELSQYEDDDGYLCITDGYRVLDAQDDYRETGFYIMDDLLLGGSPCTYWSIAKKDREVDCNGEGFRLFKEYARALEESGCKYFLYENNYSVHQRIKDEISKTLGVEPIMINSALVSAQNRKRCYWTNIPFTSFPADKGILLKDMLESGVAWQDKSYCMTAKHSSYITNKAIRAATGCSYDTAERILILFEDAGYISEKNNRFRHKVYIKNVELTKLI